MVYNYTMAREYARVIIRWREIVIIHRRNLVMHNCSHIIKLFIGLIVFTLCFMRASIAAPGDISQSPLLTSASVPPNIYFSLDSSGSMWNILPDEPYNPSVTYSPCIGSAEIPENQHTEIRIYTPNGFPFIKYTNPNPPWNQDDTFVWGSIPGTGSYGFRTRCFNPNKFYTTSIIGNLRTSDDLNQYNNVSVRVPSGTGTAIYSGNYLNWYYGTAPTIFGSNAVRKPNTKSRYQVMQEVTNNLLDTLSSKDIKVGLGDFDGSSGADILEGIQNISTNLNALKAAVNAIVPGGSTPLAETLHEIGRYFVQGYNNTLTLHPGQPNQSQKSAYSVFNRSPRVGNNVQFVSPIEHFCQKSFNIMLTDGLPTDDSGIKSSTGLVDYAGNGNQSTQVDLVDVAAALYDMDLRPDLVDQDNQSVKNNIVTYTIGFGLTGTGAGTPTPLLTDAAAQGGGLFFNALNTADLQNAFNQIAGDIQSRSASAGSLAFTSGSISSGLGAFISTYVSAEWTGDLQRIAIGTDGSVGGVIWNAASLLNAANITNRFIFTYNDQTLQPVPFRNLGDLSLKQRNDLNLGPAGSNDNKGQERINYFRGDRSNEGTVFRKRNSILYDIVDASPVFVGAPESDWPDTAPFPSGSNKYSSYKASNLNRVPYVYVGTNGGMLHGFNANSGAIGMSYVPNVLFSTSLDKGLHYVTWPGYSHRFYVDLAPQAQDAYVKVTPGGSAAWRTVLIGGLGGGGRGYFLLNVGDPSQFSDSFLGNLFMWEFTSAHDPDLGYTYSKPVIGMMNNGRWAAIFGNGYNNTASGRAKLFVVFLDGGLDGTWTEGIDYIKIDTRTGNVNNLNGLSTPAVVDLDGNRTVDRVYAGDLLGNMWAFDLSSANTSNWRVAYGSNTRPRPLFRRNNQPITGAPIVVKNPEVSNQTANAPNLIVLFGTGQYLTAADPATTTQQAFYGVWDSGQGDLRRNDLLRQPFVVNSGTTRVMNDLSVDYGGTTGNQQFGWYINLDSGERVITTPVVKSNIVFFTTLIPDASTPCSFGGTGFLMAVKVENGGEPDFVVLDINNDKVLNDQDKVNGSVVSGTKFSTGVPLQPAIRGDNIYIPKSSGEISVIQIFGNSLLEGRISWEDLRVSK